MHLHHLVQPRSPPENICPAYVLYGALYARNQCFPWNKDKADQSSALTVREVRLSLQRDQSLQTLYKHRMLFSFKKLIGKFINKLYKV